MAKQRVHERIIGKSGGTRAGKVFSKMVEGWNTHKALLERLGYTIAYYGAGANYTALYLVTFPDGHEEKMLIEQVEALAKAQGR